MDFDWASLYDYISGIVRGSIYDETVVEDIVQDIIVKLYSGEIINNEIIKYKKKHYNYYNSILIDQANSEGFDIKDTLSISDIRDPIYNRISKRGRPTTIEIFSDITEISCTHNKLLCNNDSRHRQYQHYFGSCHTICPICFSFMHIIRTNKRSDGIKLKVWRCSNCKFHVGTSHNVNDGMSREILWIKFFEVSQYGITDNKAIIALENLNNCILHINNEINRLSIHSVVNSMRNDKSIDVLLLELERIKNILDIFTNRR